MANDVYTYVEKCPSCRKRRQHPTHQQLLQLFSPERPLEFVVMNILGPLPKTKTGNKFTVVITGRFPKLTRVISTRKTTATDVALFFVEDWVVTYGILNPLLTDDGPQLVEKCFNAACTALSTELLTTTAYHPQKNGQIKRYIKSILFQLRYYLSKH